MSDPQKAHKKRGSRAEKHRFHMAMTTEMLAVAEFLGKRTFGTRTGYIEHLLLNDLRAQGLNITQVLKLAREYEKEHSAPGVETPR